MNRIEKNYIQVPRNLFYLLDGNASRVLICLIQSSTFFAEENGFFYLTKENMCGLLGISVNVLTASLDTLYINKLISITTVGAGKGKYVNHYRVNFEEFEKFDELNFEDLKNPLNKIVTVKYKNNYQPQYIKDYIASKQPCNEPCKQVCKQPCKKVITNKDNKENKTNITNKNNIYNIEYNLNNILEEKENINSITTINIKEKENKLEIIEDMKKELVEDLVSPANNGEFEISSILVDWNGENVNKEVNTTPTVRKSQEELEKMMQEVIITSTGRDEEASNFKMWVKLNKSDLNAAGLMGMAEEVYKTLKNTPKEAISAPQTPQVEQEPTSKGNGVKTPKNSRYERDREKYPSLPKMECVDGQNYICLQCGERIPVKEDYDEVWDVIDALATAC